MPKWNLIFDSVQEFTAGNVKSIFKNARIPNFKVKKIEDHLEDIEAKLNWIAAEYYTYKHLSEKDTPVAIRDELKAFNKRTQKYIYALENLSPAAKLEIGNNDRLLESLLINLIHLQVRTEKAIKPVEGKPGRSKDFMPFVIVKIAELFRDITGREPGISRKNGKPGGPFLRFAKMCLNIIDPSRQIEDETLYKHIQAAKKYLPKLTTDRKPL